MIELNVSGLAKSFGPVRVLEGLDLDVEAGEILAVLGPSGCGKTTLLRLIAGFERADAGRITLGGVVVSDARHHVPAARRHVGYVAQEGALFPHLDVAKNITFGLPYRERRHRSRVPELLELVGLDGSYATRRPHELSGGQQQRVAVARALAPRPPIVLLDEPFASLDTGLRQSTGRAVAEALRTEGATALLITHDQSEALSLAGRVAVMRDGGIAQVGSPREIYEHPADPAVATFVGSAVILPATLEDRRATCALGDVPVTGPVPGAREVDLLIRPDQLALSPRNGSGAVGHVLSVTYFGHEAETHVVLGLDGPELVARTRGAAPATRGDVVAVTVTGPVLAFPRGEVPPVAGALPA